MEKQLHTLCLVKRGSEVLLARKSRGMGTGNWNGFGGKVEPGEGIEEAAARELYEECGLQAKQMEKCAEFHFKCEPEDFWIHAHVYLVTEYEGEPISTDEMMEPRWFSIDDLPFNDMWIDDRFWMPSVFGGKKLQGTFNFLSQKRLLDYHMCPVDEFTP